MVVTILVTAITPIWAPPPTADVSALLFDAEAPTLTMTPAEQYLPAARRTAGSAAPPGADQPVDRLAASSERTEPGCA